MDPNLSQGDTNSEKNSESEYHVQPITITYINQSFQDDDYVLSPNENHMFQPVEFVIGDDESVSNQEANHVIVSNNVEIQVGGLDKAPLKEELNTANGSLRKKVEQENIEISDIKDLVLRRDTVAIVMDHEINIGDINDTKITSEKDARQQRQVFTDEDNLIGKYIIKTRSIILNQIIKSKKQIKWFFIITFAIAYPIYFGFAMKTQKPFSLPSDMDFTTLLQNHIFSNNKGLALFILTAIGYMLLLWDKIIVMNADFLVKLLKLKNISFGCVKNSKKLQMIKKWFFVTILSICCIAYLLITTDDYSNLYSLFGLVAYVLIAVLMSKHPSKINFKTVIGGILMQFILGVFVLRTTIGYLLFKFLGDQIDKFLSFTDNGSRLVFGPNFKDHFFVFKAMPVLIFFSSILNVLFYIGAAQYFIIKISWIINFVMGTSPTESVVATANIFIGQSEAPILVRPFLPQMTTSELFAVMVGGFSTVSGSILAAYIGFGISASNLLVASIMSAPAALAIAKIMYPETEKTRVDWEAIDKCPKSEATNIFEIISMGATSVLKCVGGIVANVIAFVAIFSFLDAVTGWFLGMLDIKNAGLSIVLQYLFWPLALIMGVPVEDCLSIGKLLGLKTFINEFVAYKELGDTINFRNEIFKSGNELLYRNGTLPIPNEIGMIWQEKSIIIATYALCGFSNFGSIGVQLASLSALCPARFKTYSELATMAMIGGTIACFMTACIAGLLYEKI